MSKMLIFPGQGSQIVGMGKDLYEKYPCAKAVFDEVDDALDQKLSDIIFNGPEADLLLTENTQPALMAVSMAVLTILKQEKNFDISNFNYVAGHSLGEYSALCAAEVFSLADTARLLKIRGTAMQQAAPINVGAMTAILGLSYQQVLQLISSTTADMICEIANDNSDGQVVISGHVHAVKHVMHLAKEAGAKRVVPLSVSAPFHCSLMAPAAEKIAEALSHVKMNNALVPVIANVLVKPVIDANTIKQALIDQVTGCVKWRETMDWIADHQIATVYEIGAGKVLSTLCRRVLKDSYIASIGTVSDIESIAESDL